ncbi:hypothetical protein EV188_108106 [Actinomycetospora succinea]|uniref:MYXO-CTERM domain-containing protein n=1 Tax=Actinomycetospora succinea TaxID=663603 RepID=A0A4R6UZJ8_9PSEU|nr:hypothetical protein [Actinomycetospora succinea]TDQ51746.1 hypothetical protein EV188_108106 [Actinomycetospora succinea]
MARSGRYGVVAAVSALLLLGTAGPALALPAVEGALAVPAGDGSTVDDGEPGFSVSSSVLWWSGGGLGVALAGLVAARQPTTRR